jgi:hypothetical protein
MSDEEISTGWIVCVKSASGEERFFVVAEPVQLTALQLVRRKVPTAKGDDLTLGMSVSGEQLVERGMKPGDVAPQEAPHSN